MSAVPRVYGSGLGFDLSASVTFRGVSTTNRLQSGSESTTDDYGVTSLVRKWKCRRDLTERFLPRRGDLDFQFRTLRVTTWTTSDSGKMTTITVNYNGFLNPRQPPVIIADKSRSLETVTLYRTRTDAGERLQPGDISTGDQCQLEYYAPTLTRTWASPTEPKFEDLYDFRGFRDKVLPRTYKVGGVVLLGDTKDIFSKIFRYQQRSVRSQFTPKPDGWVYRNTETIKNEIIQAEWLIDPRKANG
jgi:hypothetical protein